eukprot:1159313-Pelagomonas_calceolata.AAC.9
MGAKPSENSSSDSCLECQKICAGGQYFGFKICVGAHLSGQQQQDRSIGLRNLPVQRLHFERQRE